MATYAGLLALLMVATPAAASCPEPSSTNLAAATAEVRPWPINADEPPFLGYDGPDNATPHFSPAPFRSSDHDPIAVELEWP